MLVKNRISDYQAIYYLLNKNFGQFSCNPQLLKAIESGDVDFVRRFFLTDLDSLSLSELRNLAERKGVHPVYGKSKATLIMEIMDGN